eukprot:6206456-Pleurochrysis_carterae.AAC.4
MLTESRVGDLIDQGETFVWSERSDGNSLQGLDLCSDGVVGALHGLVATTPLTFLPCRPATNKMRCASSAAIIQELAGYIPLLVECLLRSTICLTNYTFYLTEAAFITLSNDPSTRADSRTFYNRLRRKLHD